MGKTILLNDFSSFSSQKTTSTTDTIPNSLLTEDDLVFYVLALVSFSC